MKEFIVRRFAFAELNPEAQMKAIEQEVAFLHETLDSDIITECMMDTLAIDITNGENCELDYLKLLWSLSYSQGDGVAFQGSLSKKEAAALKFPAGVDRIEIKNNGRYTHWNSFHIEYFDEDNSEIYGPIEGMESFMEYWVAMSRKLEREGYALMEDMTSEKTAREYLIDKEDCIYLESGKVSAIQGEVVHA